MYFFDTCALFSLVKGEYAYAQYNEFPVKITIFNLSEFYFLVLRDFGEKRAKELYFQFRECIIDVSDEIILDAMKMRLIYIKKKLSYADCIGYMCAQKNGLKFLTNDREFQRFSNVEFVNIDNY